MNERDMTGGTLAVETLDVVVAGLGFSGLCIAAELKRRHVDSFIVLEQKSSAGGVWRDNKYPGCEADIPALVYSLEAYPKHDWSGIYAKQSELETYINDCIDALNISDKILYDTEVTSAIFDEGSGLWTIESNRGSFRAKVFVSAVGQLNRPIYPKLPGLDRFPGPLFHSATWDHSFVATGKRIGVVGNGASAIQFVPELALEAEEVTVFQRSPSWVVPKSVRKYTKLEKFLFKYAPFYMRRERQKFFQYFEENVLRNKHGTLLNGAVRDKTLAEMRRWISDPDLVDTLTPDYAPGCKRIVISDVWYQTLARENVCVVPAGLTEIRGNVAVAADGSEHRVDALILGTGFHSTDMLMPMQITGSNGASLHALWESGPEAYKGVAVSGFPNFFIMSGPNSNTYNALTVVLENQARYISKKIRRILEKDVLFDVKTEIFRKFNDDIQNLAKDFVWSNNCGNWYNHENGKVILMYPGSTKEYTDMLLVDDDHDYSMTSRSRQELGLTLS